MTNYRLLNKSKNVALAEEVILAKSIWARLKGLLGRDHLAPGAAMWIEPCNSIHTWFMQFAIDAVFVDRQLVVKKVCRGLKPWQLVLPVWGANSVFEFAQGGALAGKVDVGDQLDVGR